MKKIYTVAKYAKSIMLAAVMTASALTTVNAQEADNTTYAPAEANSWWRGEEVTGEEQQVYVYNVGAGIFVTTDKTPSEKKTIRTSEVLRKKCGIRGKIDFRHVKSA